jgi:multidrug efflux pump subunit AcrA (membrane-fusion protein)
MFVEVELSGPPIPDSIAVPRAAIRAGRVFLIGEQNRLEIRPVTVEFRQGEEAVLSSGLNGGERLVVTDLIPAIEGMLLDPQPER